MVTSRKQIKFGVKFAVSVTNTREQEFEVINFHDRPFDLLLCEIKNTTSYPPPNTYVADKEKGIIKVQYSNKIPTNTALEMIIQGGISQKTEVVEKKVLLDHQAVKAGIEKTAAKTISALKTTLVLFIFTSLVWYMLSKSDWGQNIVNIAEKTNAPALINAVNDLDPRILTNKHPVYKSAPFTVMESIYKTHFNTDKSLSDLYNFVGDAFFVTKDLLKKQDGSYMLVTKSEADNFCERVGGRLLSINELKKYLAGQYLSIENFVWPISLKSYIPEWSGTKESWDNYWLYLKDSVIPADIDSEAVGKFVSADDGDIKAAFRCGFSENYYMPAK